MLKNIIHFVKYNNATTIIFAIVFMGGGTVFAASPDVRHAVDDLLVGKESQIISVDNTALISEDLSVLNPVVTIVDVYEDGVRYSVAYRYATFIVDNGAWKKSQKDNVLIVQKDVLGDADLAAYVKKELAQVAESDIAYLKEAQKNEIVKGATPKVTLTRYSGLLGLVVDPKAEEEKKNLATLRIGEATQPAPSVVAPQPIAEPVLDDIYVTKTELQALLASASVASSPTPSPTPTPTPNTSNTTASSTPITIQIQGNNPATINVGDVYGDLGAIITAPESAVNYGIKASLDGGVLGDISQINVDTSIAGIHSIIYSVFDQTSTTTVERILNVVSVVSEAPEPDSTSPVDTVVVDTVVVDTVVVDTVVVDTVVVDTVVVDTVVDTSALTSAITSAQSTHDSAVEGTAFGEYAIDSKAILQTAITNATSVKDNTSSIQADIDTAVTTLNTAVTTFEGGKVL